jgi:hypothetical protein
MLGDRDGARRTLRMLADSYGAVARVAAFLSQPSASAAEWSARAERALPAAGNVRNLAVGYALLLNRDFHGAAASLTHAASGGSLTGDPAPGLAFAWALIESGRHQDAAPALRFNPIPQTTGPGPFAAFYFPRIFYLRAVLAERQGKPAEARSNYQLFLQLSGPDPLQWGEEQKARTALAARP